MKLQTYINQFPVSEREAEISNIARAVGKSPVTIRCWAKGNRNIKTEYHKGIEQATNNQVTRFDLWPELFTNMPERAA